MKTKKSQMTHSHLTKGTLNDIELCKLPATLRTSNVSVSKKYLMKLSDKINNNNGIFKFSKEDFKWY